MISSPCYTSDNHRVTLVKSGDKSW